MGRLSALQRMQWQMLLDRAMKARTVSRQTGCNVLTISRLPEHIAETGSTVDRLRTGRPKVTAKRQDHQNRNGFNRSGKMSSSQTRTRIAWIGQTGEEGKNGSDIAASRSRIVEVEPASRDFSEEDKEVPTVSWQAYSPEQSPIEHLWDQIKRATSHILSPPRNSQKAIAAALEEWGNIPQVTIRPLVTACAEDARNEWMKVLDTPDIDLANFSFDPLSLFGGR
ncbi:hypothetical protein CAPTEDRAFT_192329 [Capitella teleta]|uniref:Tc1-like transposase DDE domain-containing protein n=1 Tax=Capitella teleta TaxID=283909 RepID=R7UCB5_CAPTE|nr:hypothetical protein CAPTEDRAFT_192329 [Capitella teleta]|eukprot:ELU03761.1 hypothetical protein CAPTEDRAFT_192329 [Capitella teleta]